MSGLVLKSMGSPNVLSVVMTPEKLRLSRRLDYVNVYADEDRNDCFLALDPSRKLRVLVGTREAKDVVVAQPGAILTQLAEKGGPPAAATPRDRRSAELEAIGHPLDEQAGITRWMASVEAPSAFSAYDRQATALWARNDADRWAATADKMDRFLAAATTQGRCDKPAARLDQWSRPR